MVSFNLFNGHGLIYAIVLALIGATILMTAILKKDNVEASGRWKNFGFSIKATKHDRKPRRRQPPKKLHPPNV